MYTKYSFDLWDALSDDNFRAEAYADYLNDCADNYNKLVNCLVTGLDDDYDIDSAAEQVCDNHGWEYTDENIAAAINIVINDDDILTSRAQSLLDRYGVNKNNPLSFSDGYTDALTAVKAIIKQSDKTSVNATKSQIDYINSEVITLHNVNDVIVTQKLSVQSLINEAKTSLHSVICASACALASKAESIADRITCFTDKIASTFSNAYSDASGVLQYYKNLLMDRTADSKSICYSLNQSMNLPELAAGSAKTTIGQTDISQFSGSSPVPALDFTAAANITKSVVTTTCKVVAGAVAATVNTLWSKIVKPALFKAVNKISNLIRPYDIGILNDKANTPSVDGWCFQKSPGRFYVRSINGTDVSRFNATNGTDFTISDWKTELDAVAGQWFKMDSILGEVLFRISDVTLSGGNLSFAYTFQYKPKPTHAYSLMAYALKDNSNSDTISKTTSTAAGYDTDEFSIHFNELNDRVRNYDHIADNIRMWKSMNNDNLYETIHESSDPNVATSNNERDMYLSYVQSVLSFAMLDKITAAMADQDVLGAGATLQPSSTVTFAEYADSSTLPDITNKDFLSAVSGWNGDTANPSYSITDMRIANGYGHFSSNFYNYNLTEFGYGIIWMFILQRMIRKFDSTSYPFIPYRNNVSNFNDSMYYIKTDSENQNALTTFMTNAVIVAVVAIAAISLAIGLKKFSRDIKFKRLEFLGRSDQEMWNGGSLTTQDRRKYLRYQRKLGLSSSASSGLLSGVDSLLTSFDESATDSISTISHLITG